MKLLHIPFLIVLFGFTAYVRDILNLPLYGIRILFLDMYLLLFGLCMYLYTNKQRLDANNAYRGLLNNKPLIFLISIIFITIYLNISLNILNQDSDYFFILQTTNFLLGFFYLYLIISNGNVDSFFKSLAYALWLMLIFQVSLKTFGLIAGLSGEILSNRNGIPYIALFFYFFYSLYKKSNSKNLLILVTLSALINQVNGIFVILLLYLLHYICIKTVLRISFIKAIYIPTIFILFIFGTYFGIDLFLYSFGMSPDELYSIEEYRFYLPDNIASIVSRLGSVPFTIRYWLDSGDIMGLGPTVASSVLFWGYPVHNYFASVIAISGVLGIIFSIALINVLYKTAKINIMLGFGGLFFLSVSNDLSLHLTLCFMPLIFKSLIGNSHNTILKPSQAN